MLRRLLLIAVWFLCLLPLEVAAQPEVTLPDPSIGRVVAFDELVEMMVQRSPDLERTRLQIRDTRLQIEGAYGVLDYNLTADFNLSRAENPQNNQFSDGIARNQNYDLSATLGRRFEPGTDVSLTFNGGASRSIFPTRNFLTGEVFEQRVGPIFTSGLTLSARQPLLRGFGREITLLPAMLAARSIDVQTLQLRQQAANQLLLLLNAYVELAYAQEEVDLRLRSLERTQRQLEIGGLELEAGRIAEIDLDLLRQRVAANIEALLVAYSVMQQRSRELQRLVGEERAFDQWLASTPPELELSVWDPDLLCDLARSQSPELAVLEEQIETARADLTRTSDTLDPSLDLSAGLTQAGLGEGVEGALEQLFTLEATTFFAGLSFQMNLGNRAARADHERAELAVDVARFERDEASRQLCFQMGDALTSLDLLNQREGIADYRVEVAERALAAEEARFSQGLSTVQLGLDALENLESAELESARLRVDARLARAQILAVTGELANAWINELNALSVE